MILDGLEIALLAQGLGLDGLALGRHADHAPGQLLDLVVLALGDHLNEIADLLLVDLLVLGRQLHEGFQRTGALVGALFVACNLELGAPGRDADAEGLLDAAHIFIKRTESGDELLNPLRVQGSLCHRSAHFQID